MWRGVGRICGRDFGANSNGLLGPDRMVSPFEPSLVDPSEVPVVARGGAGSCSMEKHFIGTGVGCPKTAAWLPGFVQTLGGTSSRRCLFGGRVHKKTLTNWPG
jgi:hypothetical protein